MLRLYIQARRRIVLYCMYPWHPIQTINQLNFNFPLFSTFSDETTQVNHSGMITQVTSDGDGYGVWRRPRSESSADAESVYMTNAVLSDSGYAHHSRRSSVSI